jgi:AAA15 family ATPase/GTPase
LAIFGGNASGKTNIIAAFLNYKTLIQKAQIQDLYFPNKLNAKYRSAIFEIEIYIGKDKFSHFIDYDNQEIKKEMLYKNNKTIYAIDNIAGQNNFNNVCTPDYDKNKINAILNIECCERSEQVEKSYIQKKVFLSVISKQYLGLNADITNVYKSLGNIFISVSNDFISDVLKKCNEADDIFVEKTAKFIKNFDIDIFKIQPALNNLNANIIDVHHKDIDNKEVIFDFEDESGGTKILFGLMYVVLKTLDLGHTLIIDEIDRSIHPLVFAKIIELFKDSNYNKKQAQLIFTTHCTDILEMDILRISEIATVTKTLNNGTTISRISDFKDSKDSGLEKIRNTTDFRKLYLQGAFRGIPYPYI